MADTAQYLPLSPHQFHILLALAGGDLHGYAIIKEIDRRTDGALRVGTGTLYTAMARLVDLGLVGETGREDERRRFYRLTSTGRAVLQAETTRLAALVRYAQHEGIKPLPAGRRS